MKNKIIFLILIFCIGCSFPTYKVDGENKERIFFKCLDESPKSSDNTKYNNWDKVVKECNEVADSISRKCFKNCGN